MPRTKKYVDSKHDILNNEITKIKNRFKTLSTLRSFASQILCASAGYCKVTYNGTSSDTIVSLTMPSTWGSEFKSVTVGGVNVRFNVCNDTNSSTYFFQCVLNARLGSHATPDTTRWTSLATAWDYQSESRARFACHCMPRSLSAPSPKPFALANQRCSTPGSAAGTASKTARDSVTLCCMSM